MSYFSKERRLHRKLSRAIRHHDLARMTALLDEGAPLSPPPGEDSWPPLVEAADEGFVEGIRLLVARGADIEGNSERRTALHQAVYRNNKEAAGVLLELGANIDAVMSYDKRTALLEAQYYSRDVMIDFLVEKGANLNMQDKEGKTVLHHAAYYGNASQLKMFLDHGADPSVRDNKLNTAADIARKDYPGIAAMLGDVSEPTAKPPEEGWQLTAADEVARVSVRSAIGYRLTEIFNFTTRQYVHIAQNTNTNAESHTLRGFDELPDPSLVEAAHKALKGLGGDAPAPAVVEKKKLSAPGTGQGA